MNANVIRTNRIAALMVAVLMTLTVQGGMLWGFHAVEHDNDVSSNVAVLETVTIVGHRV